MRCGRAVRRAYLYAMFTGLPLAHTPITQKPWDARGDYTPQLLFGRSIVRNQNHFQTLVWCASPIEISSNLCHRYSCKMFQKKSSTCTPMIIYRAQGCTLLVWLQKRWCGETGSLSVSWSLKRTVYANSGPIKQCSARWVETRVTSISIYTGNTRVKLLLSVIRHVPECTASYFISCGSQYNNSASVTNMP